MTSNQQTINESVKDRNLLSELKQMIFNLVNIEEDIAILDISNKSASIARVKRMLLQHGKDVGDFKKKIDDIRKALIKERGIKSIH